MDANFSWKFNAPQCQLCQAEACFIIGSILRGRALFEAGKCALILISFVDAGDVRSRWAIMSKLDEPLDVRCASRHHGLDRKSTRLNTRSLMRISSAFFCLKTKM